MMALVWAVIGIGLVAALLFGGTSLFSTNSSTTAQVREETIGAFYGMSSAYQAYVDANGISPTTAGWETELIPGYIAELKYPVSGMTWRFGTHGTYGDYFCLYGSVSEAAYNGMFAATSSFYSSAFNINTNNCAQRGSTIAAGAWPKTIYANFWLRGS